LVYGAKTITTKGNQIEMSEWRFPNYKFYKETKLGINDIFNSEDG